MEYAAPITRFSTSSNDPVTAKCGNRSAKMITTNQDRLRAFRQHGLTFELRVHTFSINQLMIMTDFPTRPSILKVK